MSDYVSPTGEDTTMIKWLLKFILGFLVISILYAISWTLGLLVSIALIVMAAQQAVIDANKSEGR
jgi:hypothetical protein